MALTRQQENIADCIRINELTLLLPLQSGATWPPPISSNPPAVLQPISISLSIDYDVRKAAYTDDLSQSVDYGALATELQEYLCSLVFPTLNHVGKSVCEYIIKKHGERFAKFDVQVTKIRGPTQCRHAVVEYSSYRDHGQWKASYVSITLQELRCPTIVGVEPHERLDRQDILVTFTVKNALEGILVPWPNLRDLVKQIFEIVYHSNCLTLEALTSIIAKGVLMILSDDDGPPHEVTVRACKPEAMPLAKSSEIVVTRTLEDFKHHPKLQAHPIPKSMVAAPGIVHTAALAIGSNLGDRFHNIELALRLLEVPGQVLKSLNEMRLDIVDTSFLYKTAPMYVTDQPAFLNCACMIETNLSPLTLLNLVKTIEAFVGRVPSIRNGPRAVDLDIILYDSACFDSRGADACENLDNLEGQLVIPHPRLREREFVLRPLNDMIPNYVHPVFKKPIRCMLADLSISDREAPMMKVLPVNQRINKKASPHRFTIDPVPCDATFWEFDGIRQHVLPQQERPFTRLMATLNTTPDSFSDGASHNDIPKALEYVEKAVAANADMIDIGGYSTRPGASFVSVQEEIDRVVPYVKAIREYKPEEQSDDSIASRIRNIPISVDTFRWEVAEAALAAGANCINDVYAFTGPDAYGAESEDAKEKAAFTLEKMKAVARKYAVPVVLMHSRGDAGKNKNYEPYKYADRPVVEGVRIELGAKVDKLVKGKGGVRRWLVVVDPGIGFSKTLDGNLEVLKNASQVVKQLKVGPNKETMNALFGMPQLIGTSRKSFLGGILSAGPHGRETAPKERGWATAATVACAAQEKAVLVRVHDAQEMADVLRVSNALWM